MSYSDGHAHAWQLGRRVKGMSDLCGPVAEAERLRGELARLREAAQAVVDQFEPIDRWHHPDESTCLHRIRARDIRALCAALQRATVNGPEVGP